VHHPLLLGHRGARAVSSIPENTFASFDLALQHGCDGFEFDVRLTSDGKAVICHDPHSNGLDISRNQCVSMPQLHLLEDLLARYKRQAFLDIELKVAGLEQTTLAALQGCVPERGFVVSSFLPEVIEDLRGRDGTVPLGIICDTRAQLARWRSLPVSHVIPHVSLTSRGLIQEVHAADRKILVWTVNSPTDMACLVDWGVDGIISDKTDLMVNTLEKVRA
jgi:glycerophosphoryl diester phosphodiesterase